MANETPGTPPNGGMRAWGARMAPFVAAGTALGVALGAAFHQPLLGMLAGIAVALTIGFSTWARRG